MRFSILLSFLILFACNKKDTSKEIETEDSLFVNYTVQIPESPEIKNRKLDQIDFLRCFFELDMKYPDYTRHIEYEQSLFSYPLVELYQIHIANHTGFRPTLLSLTDISKTHTIAKIGYFYPEENGFVSLSFIFNIMIVEGENGFKLTNMLTYNTRNWQKRNAGKITYYAKPDYRFNERKIQQMREFNQELGRFFHVNPISFEYYLSPSVKNSMQIRGYDFQYSMFLTDQIGGTVFPVDRIIFSGNNSEYYPHELVHIYIDEHYPSTHAIIEEGLAVYFGGSKGWAYEKHIAALKEYLKNNTIDFLEKLHDDRSYTIGEKTSLWYAMGSLLCDMSLRKCGKEGLFQLLNSGETEEELHESLELLFEIEIENFNDFVRKELEYYE
jgi:hypothetical protein